MSHFLCPRCAATALDIAGVVDLGADDDSDDRSLQQIACTACPFTGVAFYEESRRGSGDAYHHTAHDAPAAAAALARALAACPTPRAASCTCPAHEDLRRSVTDHTWLGPSLPMRLA
ncbi:MAG TPA: hypothetical protein VMZ28_05480 [Kofleriaceae bacterium]|nr:hypothetical protein [Kofleriaceae bacterium]